MNNYYYIIGGLPELAPGGENNLFNYSAVREEIYKQCSADDQKLIEFLESGFDENSLSGEFYVKAEESKSLFIKRFFRLDRIIRNIKVSFLAGKLFKGEDVNQDDLVKKYSVLLPSDEQGGYKEEEGASVTLDSSEIQNIETIFHNTDILEKERKLDEFKWNKINEFTAFDFFDINVILAFLVKGKLVERWNKLDRETGKALFKKLVDEVRGTFKGVEFNAGTTKKVV
ncbi:MAG: DUF2764 domain-containing protein [Bacteroidales bacterium]|nr:DUF2764 domain-containing protein [Bacteroidales bacterium]